MMKNKKLAALLGLLLAGSMTVSMGCLRFHQLRIRH